MRGPTSIREIQEWGDGIAVGFASVLFLGYAPMASGTVGSLPAIGVALWLHHRPVHLLLLAVILLPLGAAASTRAERVYGRKDPPEVTIDEFVGMLVAFLWLPMTLSSVALVFILYRLFDIFKPFPARQCERIKGGFGVMADDVVAGVYANAAFRLLLLVF
ncbi:MAG: phosphatidylglycerophosphatase A [Candidatus Hydrogenedentota bacterium]|nr:MAG: phosphatidylglycerophosphatase A [Candidatus Hydrogenedentota bacterium]